MALQWLRAISIIVGPRGDHIDNTQQAAYLQYRGGSWSNGIDTTSDSLRADADGDRLIFKGSLLPFDTVPDDGGRESASDRPPWEALSTGTVRSF